MSSCTIDPNLDASGEYTREQYEREMLQDPRQTAIFAAKLMNESLNGAHSTSGKQRASAMETAAWCLVLINALGFADKLQASPASQKAASNMKECRLLADRILKQRPKGSRRSAAGEALWRLRRRFQSEFRANRMRPVFPGAIVNGKAD